MRILYFSRAFTPHDYRFLSSLAGAGHEVYHLRLEEGEEAGESRPLPDAVHKISWGEEQWAGQQSHAATRINSLRGVFQDVKPDLVHAGPLASCAWLSARAGLTPLASMSWGFDLLYEAERSALSRRKIVFALSRSAVLIGDCQAVRQKAIQHGMPADQIVTFPWGIDLAKFTPASSRPPDGRFVLLSVRAWERIYGVDVLAEGFVRAARQRPELHLIMLGRGSLEGRLKRIYRRGGVQDRVTFYGPLAQDMLPEVYRAADLYLSASRTDGSSVSLMEAMACGLPCAVSDIPGNREWVLPGVHGWLFPDGDARALADAILSALNRRDELGSMGEAARRTAEQRADWHRNFPQLLQAYQLALSFSGQ